MTEEQQFVLDIGGPDFESYVRYDYHQTHPWLQFSLSLDKAPAQLWVLLGEARSKCESLGRIPLPPLLSKHLHIVYLAKGVQGTTAIEGNTLSEEQVQAVVEQELELPPSMEYLKREVENVVAACEQIATDAVTGGGHTGRISPDLICELHRSIMEGLDLRDGVIPGKVRQEDVGVARYRAPNWNECRHLLGRLSEFLNRWAESGGSDTDILRAIVAHVYLAWIHPFADGNGRTARLLEFYILVNAGIPTPAAHLFSNHYNQTRDKYLRELDRASKSGGDLIPFLSYALEGFVDHLREQVQVVQAQQTMLSWRDYVHEFFRPHESPVMHRRCELLLALSERMKPIKKNEIRTLSPEVERGYRDRTDKTVTRDLNYLMDQSLVLENKGAYSANRDIILGFLPARKVLENED